MGKQVIESERLSLHELSAEDSSDAAFIFRLLNEPSFLKNIGDRGVHSLEDAHGYLRLGPMASYLAKMCIRDSSRHCQRHCRQSRRAARCVFRCAGTGRNGQRSDRNRPHAQCADPRAGTHA